MSFSVLLNVFALPHHVEADWQAAEKRIDALELEDLKPYFNYWDADGDLEQETIDGLPDSIAELRAHLHASLGIVRSAIETQHPDLAVFDLVEVRFYATGGGSVGAVPSDLYDNVSELESLELLSLARFRICVVDTGPTREELEMLELLRPPDAPEPT